MHFHNNSLPQRGLPSFHSTKQNKNVNPEYGNTDDLLLCTRKPGAFPFIFFWVAAPLTNLRCERDDKPSGSINYREFLV